MASKDQYEIFQAIFDRESQRYEKLIDRGKLYLSIITLYIALLGVAAEKVLPQIAGSWFVAAAYLTSLLGLIAAFVLILLALGIYTQVYPTDPEKAFLSMTSNDEEFFDARIAELATAFKTNFSVTEKRANLLRCASFCLLFAIACQSLVVSSLLFLSNNSEEMNYAGRR